MEGTGISPGAIAGLLQTYTSGTQAADVQIGGQSYPIMVQVDPTYLSGGQSLLNLPIYSAAQRARLQVGQLGSLVLRQSPVSVMRYNRLYTATLSINLARRRPAGPRVPEQAHRRADEAGPAGQPASRSARAASSARARWRSRWPLPGSPRSSWRCSSRTWSWRPSSTRGATPSTCSCPCPWPSSAPCSSSSCWEAGWISSACWACSC